VKDTGPFEDVLGLLQEFRVQWNGLQEILPVGNEIRNGTIKNPLEIGVL